MSAKMLDFEPDLIVEATNACDRVCPGCYAPNVVVGQGQKSEDARRVDHLSVAALDRAWPGSREIDVVAVRGGEPTLNPEIGELLSRIARKARKVYLETNGGWIADGHPLLDRLAAAGVVAKVSLDRMHASSPEAAARLLSVLKAARVQTAVAITAPSREEFQAARARLLTGFEGEVIWQKTAFAADELVAPKVGVISAKGSLGLSVTHRFS